MTMNVMNDENKVRILKATSLEYFHPLPSDLQLLTVSAEQAAIFQSLSAVQPDRFQEFVADVLVIVEKHRLIDITGGPGDEKQDILTAAPDGKRQLTQCKHTATPGSKVNGDELDLMVPAALRKNCKHALFVTNGDLTAQAKRYINDREYKRYEGMDQSLLPEVLYWNGRALWEKIATNSEILNKWFSGAAQVHGLRTVLLQLVATSMPDRSIQELEEQSVATAFKAQGIPFEISSESWFSSLRAVPGIAGKLPLDAAVYALRVQLRSTVPSGAFPIDDAIANLASAALSTLEHTAGWFHLFVSAPVAVFFVHDLHRPVLAEVGTPRTMIKVNDEIEEELTWAFDPGHGFVPKDDEDELSWTHTVSGAEWSAYATQPVGPNEAYAAVLRQRQLIQSASKMQFWRFEFSRRTLELLQSVTNVKDMIFQEGGHHLLVAMSVESGGNTSTLLASYCSRNRLAYEILDEDAAARVLSSVEEMPQYSNKTINKRHEIEPPVALTERFFTLGLKKTFPNGTPQLERLLAYKWEYEAKWGFDALQGEQTKKVGSEELLGLLFEFATIRGPQMLDLGVSNGEILIFLRRVTSTTERASAIASSLMVDMQRITRDLESLVDPNLPVMNNSQSS
jgi:Restriction endonuclease